CIGRSRASRFRSGNFEAYKVPLAQGWVAFQSPSAVAADVRAIQLPDGSIPDLPPSRKGKVTETYKIDGTPLVFRVEDEDFFVAPSNPKKAFRLQLLRFDDGQGIDSGHLAIRIAYYMIAHKESRRGKWLFGQFAPMMTPDELKLIIEKVRLKGWIPD
ncbi:MAG TPA: hypothetical protein VF590_23375, partial [Isosphaeraceae bacterium]